MLWICKNVLNLKHKENDNQDSYSEQLLKNLIKIEHFYSIFR